MSFSNIKACVFDAYGTLLDFNSAVEQCRDRIGDQTDLLSELWRRKQLEYTWLRSLMGRHADFWQVTGEALDYALAATGIDDEGTRRDLLSLYRTLSPYGEVKETLEAVRKAGLPTAILSNGEPSMLEDAVEAAGLAPLIDTIYSVEDVGKFKPHPSVYQLASDGLSLPPGDIAFFSANGWDIAGAGSFGFATAWINRAGLTPESLPPAPAATLSSLKDLPVLLGLT